MKACRECPHAVKRNKLAVFAAKFNRGRRVLFRRRAARDCLLTGSSASHFGTSWPQDQRELAISEKIDEEEDQACRIVR